MSVAGKRIDEVRRFNRFYTQKIGVLDEGLLRSRFSLTEVRVLYELAHGGARTARELGATLGIDAGYLSRIVHRFVRGGLLARAIAERDGRTRPLELTTAGRRAFAPLDARAREQVAALLAPLAATEQTRLCAALRTVELLLGGLHESARQWTLRGPRPGDLGWVVQRHGALYASEYGWDVEFERLVARIVADFDPERDRCWMAELDGERVGCVLVVHESKTVARLRLLLVEPQARGLGIGARLVEECVQRARQAAYRRLDLWTQSNLHAARRIYERAGFRLVREKKHRSFGHDLVAQDWSLAL
jgi:DNA-binding MarR family transcriptional regulator/N-acetylglutamate synthase-like GNAT family acetyltransferase